MQDIKLAIDDQEMNLFRMQIRFGCDTLLYKSNAKGCPTHDQEKIIKQRLNKLRFSQPSSYA